MILMYGIEVESIIVGLQFARITDNLELKQQLACSAGSHSSSRRS